MWSCGGVLAVAFTVEYVTSRSIIPPCNTDVRGVSTRASASCFRFGKITPWLRQKARCFFSTAVGRLSCRFAPRTVRTAELSSLVADSRTVLDRKTCIMTKRTFDFLLALTGIVFLAPVLLTVALLIKATSAGPIIFGHERAGRGGSRFRVYKFRTMVHNAAQPGGPLTLGGNDPRITSVGISARSRNSTNRGATAVQCPCWDT